MEITPVKPGIMHLRYTKDPAFGRRESEIVEKRDSAQKGIFTVKGMGPEEASSGEGEERSRIAVSDGAVTAEVMNEDFEILWKDAGGKLLLSEGRKEFIRIPVMSYTTGGEKPVIDRVKTVDGERNFIKNLREEKDHEAYQGRLYFHFSGEEQIHGLGQGEDGVYDYRHHVQYLYQHNMRIPMPMLLSTRGYGILFDAACLMTFNDTEVGTYVFFDAVEELSYYFIKGDTADDIIAGFRYLTGDAAMLPKWAFGYIQSKEQYYTAKELLEVAQRYRDLQIPLDCVVQDWNTWEEGKWGNKLLDPARYGDMRQCAKQIHDLHVHTMVSVWPNMNSGTENYEEFMEKGQLLNDLSTYDAFDEKARETYWKQAKEGLFDQGFDSFWCDSTEPFSGPDWGGEIRREPHVRFALVGGEHKKYLPPEKANLYALMHAKGIFENMRRDAGDRRVLNLTRSGYASGQKYAAMLWSGDTCASWETLKKQIVEGMNMGLSGYPYWTLDIGGFFTVGKEWQKRGCGCDKDPTPKWFWTGEYDDGVEDGGYRELYVRWLQLGAFLPMFRSHGTDTPREIWNFGKGGEPAYDAIARFIRLRYRLMPYIYSMAGAVRLHSFTIMRSLIFDFPEDPRALEQKGEFMFGKNLLVCPVTEPMYYRAGNEPVIREKTWNCYLPRGCRWIDFWDGTIYEGGSEVRVEAGLDRIPLFVRQGSILPERPGLSYASEEGREPLELHVYTGSDGEFLYYDDAGEGYAYEDGDYETVELAWHDSQKKLVIGKRKGSFAEMRQERQIKIFADGKQAAQIRYDGTMQEILL
ncbi:MAG: glycoside hydrolase family 31 protein [Lachnospiraceae bacterium]|nr:glycoside hydrolase family 31 protein [Lachnospiraceae bacterium]